MVPRMSRPSGTEQDMIRAAEAGEIIHLSRRSDNVLRAKVIREVLRSNSVDPRGIRVRGARITGDLDLADLQISASLELDDSVFDEPPFICNAELPSLTFDGSTLPGLNAPGLRVRYFGMRDARCTGLM